jgi:hypothetical protein
MQETIKGTGPGVKSHINVFVNAKQFILVSFNNPNAKTSNDFMENKRIALDYSQTILKPGFSIWV